MHIPESVHITLVVKEVTAVMFCFRTRQMKPMSQTTKFDLKNGCESHEYLILFRFALCSVKLWLGSDLFYPYPHRLLHWQCRNSMTLSMSVVH